MVSPRVAVVILNWNGKQHLEECLSSVLAQALPEPFEVVVWDNGSSDGSQAFVRDRFRTVRLHDAGENLGFAKAMNGAAALVEGEYMVLLNNDTRAEPGWLQELVRVADASPADVVSVGSRMVLYDRPDIANHVGAKVAIVGGGYDEGLWDPVANFDDRPAVYPTGASCGGAALFRRQAFLEMGGFDATFFLYFEDTDFGLRAWMTGRRILHASRSVVRHKLGASSGGRESSLLLYWSQRNRIRMMVKNVQRRRFVLAALFSVHVLLWTSAVLFLRGNRAGVVALWRGSRDALRGLPDAWKERKRIQGERVLTDRQLVRLGVVATVRQLGREVTRQRKRHAALAKEAAPKPAA